MNIGIRKILSSLRNPQIYFQKLKPENITQNKVFNNELLTNQNGIFKGVVLDNKQSENQLHISNNQHSTNSSESAKNSNSLNNNALLENSAGKPENNVKSEQLNTALNNLQKTQNTAEALNNQNKPLENIKKESIIQQNNTQNNSKETTNQTILNREISNQNTTKENTQINNNFQVNAAKNQPPQTTARNEILNTTGEKPILIQQNKNINGNENIAKYQTNQNSITSNNLNQAVNTERSAFVKNLLGLPPTLGEILFAAQNKNNPINTNTLMLNNLNQDIIQNQKILSQIFDDTEIKNLPVNILPEQITQQVASVQQKVDAVSLLFSGMVQMPEISKLILANSKNAVAQLVIEMANATHSKASTERLKDTLNVLNSCIAMADSGSPAQTLKSLMLLYLPWLPLNEEVGFDLEVEAQPGENESNASKLTVLIQTRNYGNVKGVFTLTSSNSVDAYIICSEDFPKKILQKSLLEESKVHSMSANIDIESVTPIKKENNEKQEAKVNLSATNEMNPYLLLIAHAFIRKTIQIDSGEVTATLAADEA